MLQACSNGHVNMRQVGHGIVRLHGLQTHRLLPCIKPLSAARHSMRAAATHSSSEPPVESQDVPDEQQLANQQAAPQGDQQPAGKVSAFTRRSTMLGSACGCASCLATSLPLITLPASAQDPCHASSRASWYDRYLAWGLHAISPTYEAAIAPVKASLSRRLIDSVSGPSLDRPLRILDVGIGTGPNLQYLVTAAADSAAAAAALANIVSASIAEASGAAPLAALTSGAPRQLQVVGVDPNTAMAQYAAQSAAAAGLRVVDAAGAPIEGSSTTGGGRGSLQLVEGAAELLPFPDAAFDAAVVTLVLCSVRDPSAAVAEVKRVVRPGGAVMFIEHVGASWSDARTTRLTQSLLDPLQQVLAGGCHLTRDTGGVYQAAGFSHLDLTAGRLEGVGSIFAPHVWGVAVV